MITLGALLIIPSLVVPVTVAFFFWEMNIPRNIAIYDLLKFIVFGGIACSTIATILGVILNQSEAETEATFYVAVGIVEELTKLIIIIPENTEKILFWAFKDCSSLQFVKIPYSTDVNDFAFDGTPFLDGSAAESAEDHSDSTASKEVDDLLSAVMEAYKPPAEVVKIDLNAKDPSTDEMRFTYDEDGRVTQCSYSIDGTTVNVSYSYKINSVQIYAFMSDFIVGDQKIQLRGEYDPSVGFTEVDGFYLKGYTF